MEEIYSALLVILAKPEFAVYAIEVAVKVVRSEQLRGHLVAIVSAPTCIPIIKRLLRRGWRAVRHGRRRPERRQDVISGHPKVRPHSSHTRARRRPSRRNARSISP